MPSFPRLDQPANYGLTNTAGTLGGAYAGGMLGKPVLPPTLDPFAPPPPSDPFKFVDEMLATCLGRVLGRGLHEGESM